jgi:hypothetical protein
MRFIFFVLLLTYDRFTQKHSLELEAFFEMKDRILSFDDILREFKDDAERLNTLGKLVSA